MSCRLRSLFELKEEIAGSDRSLKLSDVFEVIIGKIGRCGCRQIVRDRLFRIWSAKLAEITYR